MTTQKEIADRLRNVRIKRGYKSARNFSKTHGIAESTYAQHESGKRKLSLCTLLEYSNKLSTNPGWLLTGSGPVFFSEFDEVQDETTTYVVAYTAVIIAILKQMIPAIANNEIHNKDELYSAVKLTYDELKHGDFRISQIADTVIKIIDNMKIGTLPAIA